MQKPPMKSTKQLILLLIAFSLSGCAGIQKPNTDLCIVNAPPGDTTTHKRKCYNMATDFDDNGVRLPAAKPVYRENPTVQDLNKFLVIDSPTGTVDGQAALQAWVQKLRQHFANCQNPQQAEAPR
jgi:hypothetical protein